MSTTTIRKKTTKKPAAKKTIAKKTTVEKTTTKKTTTKKTDKKVRNKELITITGEIDSKTDIFNLSNASIKFLTENKTIAKEISKIINNINILNDKKEEVKELNKKYIILACINQRKAKIKDKKEEIKEIIKDFDYYTKKDYKNGIARIENHINNTIKELENIQIQNFGNEHIFMIDKINELIEDFNRIYKNAYNKKNNESSLSYIMDIEIEENTNLDLVKTIDINDFK